MIPTRNRIAYAISGIKGILSIPSPRLELVVQDSGDSNSLETHIRSDINDPRLRYNYNAPPFSSVDNFNKAAQLATGEYVCFIGDDDGVNLEILQVAAWARQNGFDAIRPNPITTYYWPDVQFRAGRKSLAGSLVIGKFSGRVSFPDVEKEVRRCVLNAGQGYLAMDLPKVYHGIVHRQCLEKLYRSTGAYFKGLSPDIYSALALTNFTKRICTVDYPLTIGGTSILSTAGDSIAGKHKGKVEDAPHMRDRKDYRWPETIPNFYSVQTIWAESALAALRESNRSELVGQFNFPLLYAICMLAHPDQSKVILETMYRTFRNMNKSYISGTLQFLTSVPLVQRKRIVKYILRKIRSRFYEDNTVYGDIETMEECIAKLTDHLKDNRLVPKLS